MIQLVRRERTQERNVEETMKVHVSLVMEEMTEVVKMTSQEQVSESVVGKNEDVSAHRTVEETDAIQLTHQQRIR